MWDPAKASPSIVPPSSENAEDSAAVGLDDFYAYMPMHNYIFTPTRDMWPGSSVNSRIPPVQVGGKKIPATAWLDMNKPVEQMTWMPGEPMIDQGSASSPTGGFIKRNGVPAFNLYRAADAQVWRC